MFQLAVPQTPKGDQVKIDAAFDDLIRQMKNSDPLSEDRSSNIPILVGLIGELLNYVCQQT